MAKQFDFKKLNKDLNKIEEFEMGDILERSTFSEVDHYISSGNYLLNAQLSGSLFGGYPNCKTVGIAGDPSCMQKNQKIRIYKLKTPNLYDKHKKDKI